MALAEYRRKRDFDKTREPAPSKAARRSPGRLSFVVQLHHASRRHYDFRLELDGVLKSWAVPKGPSYDPSVKRMAIEVEDHPLDYATFEGQIPQGEYGGGHVAVFDHGIWQPDGDPHKGLAKGHLRFELFGDKLKGSWHLVRSGKPARQPQWLLFKDDDAFAGSIEADDLLADVTSPPAADLKRAGSGKAGKKNLSVPPTPASPGNDWKKIARKIPGARVARLAAGPVDPQLAKLTDTPPVGTQWLHEIKWDGYRIIATIVGGQVQLWSRNGIEWTEKLPEIASSLQELGVSSLVLDGEMIAGSGKTADFNLLQAVLSGEARGSLLYTVFDILHIEGVDLADAPLVDRKGLLEQLLRIAPARIGYSSHVQGDGAQALEVAAAQDFEGIISKRADRPYHHGRNDDWRKSKNLASDEFAVVGYTPAKGSRQGFGSLLLARPAEDGDGWVYAGRVGSGFSDQQLRDLATRLPADGTRTPTARIDAKDTDLRAAKWFAPCFVVEVFYRGIGGQQLLRQPSLKTLREDKDPDDLRDSDRRPSRRKTKKTSGDARVNDAKPARGPSGARAKAATSKAGTKTTAPSAEAASKAPAKRASARATAGQGPTLSSPDKVIFPDVGASKRDVWDYYDAVADELLPGIVGRPLSIIRCPSGISGQCFFQKHQASGLAHVDTVPIIEDDGDSADYLVVNDKAGLLELVQFNALEFHPWGAHADDPDIADRMIFDLDPGPGVEFATVKRAAADIRKLLERIELQSFLRTSGGKGLHVVVPLSPGSDWDRTKRFCHAFADSMAAAEPERYVATASKKIRDGRIFIDYLRNGRGATAVASWSLRARPGAPVAVPIAWSELPKLQSAAAWDINTAVDKLRRRRKDPWEGIDAVRQDLSRWVE